MGDYCSFCEMPLAAALAVEHIRCKDSNLDLELEWTNFLLACPSCNSTKGTKVDTAEDVQRYSWPHLNRTFDLFDYTRGIIRVVVDADPELAGRAKAVDELVGLSRRPGAGLTRAQVLRGSDNRYKKRRETWDEAIAARQDLREQDSPIVRRQILATARARGFWSVWMTVFRDDEQMQAALCEAFAGTAKERVYPLPPHLQPPSPNETS
ncbi:MAG: HNH endonuclease [Deltaproteobacteria bacterium]|nr:HNH endonuclease [Deltaproteobacteria bacterium]